MDKYWGAKMQPSLSGWRAWMYVPGAKDYLLPPTFLRLESSALSKLLTEEAMPFPCFNVVLQWLFAMGAAVSQVRYKTEKFSPLYCCCRPSWEDASLSVSKLHLPGILNNCQYTYWGILYLLEKNQMLCVMQQKKEFSWKKNSNSRN